MSNVAYAFIYIYIYIHQSDYKHGYMTCTISVTYIADHTLTLQSDWPLHLVYWNYLTYIPVCYILLNKKIILHYFDILFGY